MAKSTKDKKNKNSKKAKNSQTKNKITNKKNNPSKTKKESSKATTNNIITKISAGLLVIAILGFAGLIGYKFYNQSKQDDYNRRIYEIQLSTGKKMQKLNPMFRSFVATPSYAKKLGPKFEEASDIANRTVMALKTVDVSQKNKDNHEKLIEIYEQGSRLYADLASLSRYTITRDKIIKAHIKELKNFAKKMEKTKKRGESLEIAANAQNSLKTNITKIKKIKTEINIYDEKLLIKYTNSLNTHLKELQESITKKKVYETKLALHNIEVDYTQNWQNAFYNEDKKEITKYNERVNKINNLLKETKTD